MKHLSTFFALFAASVTNAQLINGDFESNGAFDLAGWTPSACAQVSGSTTVFPGNGSWSLRMRASDSSICSTGPNLLTQPIPWIADGQTIVLTYWYYTDVNIVLPGAQVMIGELIGDDFIPQWTHSGEPTNWLYVSIGGVIDLCDNGVAAVALSPGFARASGGSAYFDQITLLEYNVGIGPPQRSEHPTFRPNPATDKLWVDLPEAPLSITAIDAIGRTQALRNFQHTSHTLELDVSALPPGLNVLQVTTSRGTRAIRFMKA